MRGCVLDATMMIAPPLPALRATRALTRCCASALALRTRREATMTMASRKHTLGQQGQDHRLLTHRHHLMLLMGLMQRDGTQLALRSCKALAHSLSCQRRQLCMRCMTSIHRGLLTILQWSTIERTAMALTTELSVRKLLMIYKMSRAYGRHLLKHAHRTTGCAALLRRCETRWSTCSPRLKQQLQSMV